MLGLSIQEAGPVARMGPVTSSSEGGLGSVSGMSPIIVRADSVEGTTEMEDCRQWRPV